MKKTAFTFSKQTTTYYLDAAWADFREVTANRRTILVTDENVYRLHREKFEGWEYLTIAAGEKFKQQSTVDRLIQQLIEMEADRSTLLVGVGGGVVTDITGYVASVYMRGIAFGFVPTTLLAMVDAANGGKNGVDVGSYKNLVGTINQPEFLFFELNFLSTLPEYEFNNGCAEMIKHACILDVSLFHLLSGATPRQWRTDPVLLADLVERNVLLKSQLVQEDEFEKGDRALLNFGHTFGHAIETAFSMMHGEAISIGMVMALRLSEKYFQFPSTESEKVITLLRACDLPVDIPSDISRALHLIRMDKKRKGEYIRFVLLKEIGRAKTHLLPVNELDSIIKAIPVN
jgi:3-dehydroquinate synthase